MENSRKGDFFWYKCVTIMNELQLCFCCFCYNFVVLSTYFILWCLCVLSAHYCDYIMIIVITELLLYLHKCVWLCFKQASKLSSLTVVSVCVYCSCLPLALMAYFVLSCMLKTRFLSKKSRSSYVYWTVHHLDSWIKIDQLDVTCFIISLFNAQHVSNVSTSILRNLRLIC